MKERLIELLKDMQDKGYVQAKNEDEISCHVSNKNIAQYLLKNGVIVPPCKVGQTVFKIVKLYGDRKPIIVEGEIFEIALTHENGEIKNRFYFLEKGGNKIINRYSLWHDFDEVGKTVFFTKKEAQKALGGVEK